MVFDVALLTDATRARLCEAVRSAYSSAALEPHAQHPFPVGREFARSLGYPLDLLDSVSPVCVDAFAGVSNLAVRAGLTAGARVLDLGCGAGLDSLIAARRVGPSGRVVGLDFSGPMLARAQRAAREAGASHVTFCRADAQNLPLRDGSMDVALVNGIFNLNPGRAAIFRELARVVRAGGRLFAAELVLREPLPPASQVSEADWFS